MGIDIILLVCTDTLRKSKPTDQPQCADIRARPTNIPFVVVVTALVVPVLVLVPVLVVAPVLAPVRLDTGGLQSSAVKEKLCIILGQEKRCMARSSGL